MRLRLSLGLLVLSCFGLTSETHLQAGSLQFDQNVTNNVIFGSGNANGGFTVNRMNGVELGLRGKLRFNASNQPENTFNSNGDGTYSFDAGQPPSGFTFAPGSSSTAKWNFEWSINSNFDGSGGNLSDFTYEFGLDFDPSQGTNFQTFDPINTSFADHGIGTNATGPGAGTKANNAAEYATLIMTNNVAQNSWNMEFFDNGSFPFDGNVDGTYDFYIEAYDDSGLVARTEIQIIAGEGGAVVPEPASLAVWGMVGGLVCAGVVWRRRQQKSLV